MLEGDIINATNLSSDSGLGKANPCIQSEGMMPMNDSFCIAEASHFITNGFNLRLITRVAWVPRPSPF